MCQLNFDSPVPLYQQIYNVLLERIKSGTYTSGKRLPTEAEISSMFSVSRITVRKAMEMLEDDNYIIKRAGKGSFVVSQKLNESLLGDKSFSTICKINNTCSSSWVVERQVRPASAQDMELLQLKEGQEIIHMLRLRYADDDPVMVESIHMNAEVFAPILQEDMGIQSLYEVLAHLLPERTWHMQRTLELSSASSRTAKLLNLPSGSPILMCQELVRDQNGTPLFYINQRMAGEKIRFVTME